MSKLHEKLREALNQREIDAAYVRDLIRRLQAKETFRHWLSLGMAAMLVLGVSIGLTLSVREVVFGA